MTNKLPSVSIQSWCITGQQTTRQFWLRLFSIMLFYNIFYSKKTKTCYIIVWIPVNCKKSTCSLSNVTSLLHIVLTRELKCRKVLITEHAFSFPNPPLVRAVVVAAKSHSIQVSLKQMQCYTHTIWNTAVCFMTILNSILPTTRIDSDGRCRKTYKHFNQIRVTFNHILCISNLRVHYILIKLHIGYKAVHFYTEDTPPSRTTLNDCLLSHIVQNN